MIKVVYKTEVKNLNTDKIELSETIKYDKRGNIIYIKDGDSEIFNKYDSHNNLINMTINDEYWAKFEYDKYDYLKSEFKKMKVFSLTPEKEDYVFTGWKERGTDNIYQPGTSTAKLTTNMLLDAIWKEDKNHNHIPDEEETKYIILNNKKETVFVRYKSLEAENQYLKVVEDKLLQDKKNFKIKRKYL